MHTEDERTQDEPWNDSPADAGLPAEVGEPEPAEVEGEEGDEVDSTAPRSLDAYHRDTLDERLAEEEPDRTRGSAQSAQPVELVDPERGGGDVVVGEPRGAGEDPADAGPAAEEAAVHIVDEDRV